MSWVTPPPLTTTTAITWAMSLTDPDSRYRYTYDLAGRLTIVDNTRTPNSAIVLLSYGYDAVNNLTSVTDTINSQQAGTTAYTYRCLKP